MKDLLLSKTNQNMKEKHFCPHTIYTECLYCMAETEILEDIKARRETVDTRDSVRGDGGGKGGYQEGKEKSKIFEGHKNGKLFDVDTVYGNIFNGTNIQYIYAGKFILHTVIIYSVCI